MKTTIVKTAVRLILFFGVLGFLVPTTDGAPTLINFQGELTNDLGNPVDGTLPMTFRIFNAGTGGSTLWEEDQTVIVAAGIYNVLLGSGNTIIGSFDPSLFESNSRWLEVEVNGEVLTPRQQVTSVAFALQAEEANNSVIAGDADTVDGAHASALEESAEIDADIALHTTDPSIHHIKTMSFAELIDTADDTQIPASIARDSELAWANLTGIPAGFADGIDDDTDTTYLAGTGINLTGNTFNLNVPLSLNVAQANPVIRADNSGSGFGIIGTATSVTGIEGFSNSGTGVSGYSSTGTGVNALTNGASGKAVSANSTGKNGTGVYGSASNSEWDAKNYGGYFEALGGSGTGVYGESVGGYGGHFVSQDTTGTALYAESPGYGVEAKSTQGGGIGVNGWASDSGDFLNYGGFFKADGVSGRGVYGRADGSKGIGVYGEAWDNSSDQNYGGYFYNGGPGIGVLGMAGSVGTPTGIGVWGVSWSPTGIGVRGEGTSGSATGVSGRGIGIGVLGESSGIGFGGVGVSGTCWDGKGVYGEAKTGAGGYFKSDSGPGLVVEKGKVGLGKTNPAYELDMVGNIMLYGNQGYDAAGEDASVYFGHPGVSIRGEYGTGVVMSSFAAPDSLTVRELSGNVGIGTLNPSEKLYVIGNIYATGNVSWGSSRELKEGIHQLGVDEALNALNDLNPMKYYYKADKEDQHIGFIAEDVPELLAAKDRKSLDPMDIVAVLAKVVQEQQRRIEELEERLR